MTPSLYQVTESELLEWITAQQNVQRRNPPTSVAWRTASERLQPLFAEMARRQSVTH